MIIKLPPITCHWLYFMTDDTGVLQHAKFSIPNRKEGYATDDNARALLAILEYYSLQHEEKLLETARTYLSFLFHSQEKDGRVHNFMGYDRRFRDKQTSCDSLGRVLWACGYAQDTSIPEDFRMVAKEIFDKALSRAVKSESPRTHAFAILGLYHYAKAFPEDENPRLNITLLADDLCGKYESVSTPSWKWFETYTTYANSRLPQALFRAYQATGNQRYLDIAEETLSFLASEGIVHDQFQPVGNKDWHFQGSKRGIYDQQPIEASSMIDAASAAFQATKKEEYLKMAHIAFDWFMGKNSKGLMVYNPVTGGCYDGITPEGLNKNQGAEAGLSFLLARLEMEILSRGNF
jgi:hypothetical protein